MNKKLLFLWFAFISLAAVSQVSIDQTTTQLASKYFTEGDYTKAAPLFREIYGTTGNSYYFRLYLHCLTELGLTDEAESEVRKEIKKTKSPQPELLIPYGHILKAASKPEEAKLKYEEAIRVIPKNKSSYINTANIFIQWSEFEYAEKVFLRGREKIPGEKFHSELSQVYLYLRNYSRLIEELLELVKLSDENLPAAQSSLTSALYMDVENNLGEEFRSALLRRIQAEPEVISFNRLLIWFFMQEKQFSAALRQSIALDRRTRQEEPQILSLAQMAMNNRSYEDAAAAYAYLLAKGKESPSWVPAYSSKLHAEYLHFMDNEAANLEKAKNIAGQFRDGLTALGYTLQNVPLIREYANLMAFYLDQPDSAVAIIGHGLEIPALRPELVGELKTELADIYVYAGDPWEAMLLYSQVIDANRNNSLSDEVKLKKAKLGYYMGNFSWAKAQLDVLKASTSKLTANDAMELALFIGNNSNLDTTEIPLGYFARADLLFFRNKDREALLILDTLEIKFPYHELVDDILFRKARIDDRNNNFIEAARHLERIVTEFPEGLLADDALFLLGDIRQFRLNDQTKAAEAYKTILFSFPGSIYITEARKRYRELTGDKTSPEPQGSTPKDAL